MISPILPIYKTSLRKQPNKNGYSQNSKQKILCQKALKTESSVGLSFKISVNKDFWEEVEYLQRKLSEVVSKKGINSPEAIRASQAFRNKMKEYSDLQ